MKSIKKASVLMMLLVFFTSIAQQHLDPEYIKVTNERATKIVEKLGLKNPEKEKAVIDIVAQQFRDLSEIQDGRDAEIKKIKEDTSLAKEKQNESIDKLKSKANQSIEKLHKAYLKKLGKQLSEDKITEVKDGMTYGVLPITVAGYNDMLPNLTAAQKEYIYNALVEAREYAMDGGSSKEKHAWFGKYKGRINNYLSKEGYDLNKESTDWHKRLEDREKEKAKN
jgi:rubrerythrin